MKDRYLNMKKCPKCGQPLLFSFCLPYKEYVCVPCGVGFEFLNGCETINVSEKEKDKLYKKYKIDIQKISLNTAKNGGGRCKICGTKFNCKKCQKIEKHELKYWGKTKNF